MSEKAVNGLCSQGKVLTLDTMNPNVRRVEYAVRGPLVQRALQLEKELKEVTTPKFCVEQQELRPTRDTHCALFQHDPF